VRSPTVSSNGTEIYATLRIPVIPATNPTECCHTLGAQRRLVWSHYVALVSFVNGARRFRIDSPQGNLVRMMHQPVQDRIGQRWVAQRFMPVLHRHSWLVTRVARPVSIIIQARKALTVKEDAPS